MPESVTFHDVIRARHSARDFLATPVPENTIRSVLADAQLSPSNCNTQPWDVHIISGTKRDELSAAFMADYAAGNISQDFTFDMSEYYDKYKRRSQEQGAVYYQTLGVKREDFDERRTVAARNLSFFGAPHVALLYVPSFGDNVRVASDVGMYAQTFLLSLVAHGLGGIPQTMLGMFADTARRILQINDKSRLLFGISFGYPNNESASNKFRMTRASIDENVSFHY
jgi:nitroreductase